MAVAELSDSTRFGISRPRRFQLVALVVLFSAWELASATGIVYRGVIPSWVTIGIALWHLLLSPAFWFNLSVTLSEIVAALMLGSTAGAIAGLLVGSSRLTAATVEPIANALVATPKVVFLPLLYLVFGIGPGSKVAVGALGAFFPMLIGVTVATLRISPVWINVGRSFGLGRVRLARMILLPALIEPILNGLRIGAGVAIGACIIGETRFSYAGLGFMVLDAFNRSRFPQFYAMLVIVVALAVALNAVIGRVHLRFRGA